LVFACDAPEHHDGDAIRCQGQERAMRMHAIDAPEMPGACRPGRQCTPGDPYAARDYLRSLTRGRTVRCEEKDVDAYGRMVVRCTADSVDLGCAMVNAGHAVERYGRLNCAAESAANPGYEEVPLPLGYESRTQSAQTPQASVATAPTSDRQRLIYVAPAAASRSDLRFWAFVATALLAINALTWGAFAWDKHLARENGKAWARKRHRLPERMLLMLASIGGTPAAFAARSHFRHKTTTQPFSNLLIGIAGLQFGIIAGLLLAL
jgi:uncharacterized membrane protein YsdA (DUF1294 family)